VQSIICPIIRALCTVPHITYTTLYSSHNHSSITALSLTLSRKLLFKYTTCEAPVGGSFLHLLAVFVDSKILLNFPVFVLWNNFSTQTSPSPAIRLVGLNSPALYTLLLRLALGSWKWSVSWCLLIRGLWYLICEMVSSQCLQLIVLFCDLVQK